jgi:hypothetical protein
MTAPNFATSILASTSGVLSNAPATLSLQDLDSEAPQITALIRVYGDVDFHVSTNGQPATTADYPQEAGRDGILLSVAPGKAVSVIKANGATNGSFWASWIKRL